MTYGRAYRFWELMYSSHVHDGGSELDEPGSIVTGIHFVGVGNACFAGVQGVTDPSHDQTITRVLCLLSLDHKLYHILHYSLTILPGQLSSMPIKLRATPENQLSLILSMFWPHLSRPHLFHCLVCHH
jgi:hypothetical protein